MKKILLIEDDLILGETVTEILESEGFEVVWVKDGQSGLDESFEQRFDLYLFDVNVPFINGFELLNDLRNSGDKTPAIFLTALVDTGSLKKGFDAGADDYIKKPFDMDELIIRVDSTIKKAYHSYAQTVEYGELRYDIDSKKLFKGEVEIHLSPNEHKILELFLKNIDKPVSKEELLFYVHNDSVGSEAALRVHISKLKKLGLHISNIRGIGYRCDKV